MRMLTQYLGWLGRHQPLHTSFPVGVGTQKERTEDMALHGDQALPKRVASWNKWWAIDSTVRLGQHSGLGIVLSSTISPNQGARNRLVRFLADSLWCRLKTTPTETLIERHYSLLASHMNVGVLVMLFFYTENRSWCSPIRLPIGKVSINLKFISFVEWSANFVARWVDFYRLFPFFSHFSQSALSSKVIINYGCCQIW